MAGGVWTFAEQKDGELLEVSLEILADGCKIADKRGEELVAIAIGSDLAPALADTLAHYGADRVLIAEHELLEQYSTDGYTAALVDLIRRMDPSVVIIGATATGRDFAPRVAARLRVGLVSERTILKPNDDGTLEMTGPAFDDKVYTTLVCGSGRPQMATIKPGVIGLGKPDLRREATVERIRPELAAEVIRTRLIGTIPADPATVDLTEAELIVAGGRGVNDAESWSLIEELAEAMGASVGASRMAVDSGWVPYERQVGQTGRVVSPRLYLACGISGASQHTAGIRNPRMLVAINTDRNAAIFKAADMKVVASLHELIPELVARLRQVRSERVSSNG